MMSSIACSRVFAWGSEPRTPDAVLTFRVADPHNPRHVSRSPLAARCPVSPVRSVSRFAAFSLVVVGACVRDARIPSEPAARQAPQFAAVVSSGGASAATGRHIVSFSGAVPTDFTSRVEALGGKVLWVSAGSGLAAVSGLQEKASSTLAAGRGIQAVDADEAIPLDVPLVADEAGALVGVQS